MHLEKAQLPSSPKMQHNNSLVKVKHYCRLPETSQVEVALLLVVFPDASWSPDYCFLNGPPPTKQHPSIHYLQQKQETTHNSARSTLTEKTRSVLCPFVTGRIGRGVREADRLSTSCSGAPATPRENLKYRMTFIWLAWKCSAHKVLDNLRILLPIWNFKPY